MLRQFSTTNQSKKSHKVHKAESLSSLCKKLCVPISIGILVYYYCTNLQLSPISTFACLPMKMARLSEICPLGKLKQTG